MLNAKLVVVGGDAKAKEIRLKLPCIIGRGRDATLTLPHPLVSRQHTMISEKDGKLFVKDMGSLNGTFLNNKKLEAEALLEPNQLLTLGNVTFRAVYEVGDLTGLASADTEDVAEADTGDLDLNQTDVKEKPESGQDSQPVFEEDASPAAEDTDKSLLDKAVSNSEEAAEKVDSGVGSSDIFSGVETGESSNSAISSIDGLPEAGAAMSFAGGIDLGDDKPAAKPVDSINLDLGEETSSKDADDSGLDSFIKKLPR